MPTYEYVCEKCGYEFERFQSMTDPPVKTCPECKSRKVRRLIGSGAGIIFKGSGFYETDYKRKQGSGKSSSDGKDKGEKTETKSSSDSKSKKKKGDKKEAA